jgi:hypothetical protein
VILFVVLLSAPFHHIIILGRMYHNMYVCFVIKDSNEIRNNANHSSEEEEANNTNKYNTLYCNN